MAVTSKQPNLVFLLFATLDYYIVSKRFVKLILYKSLKNIGINPFISECEKYLERFQKLLNNSGQIQVNYYLKFHKILKFN